jgi:hypothetical protein
MAKYILFCLMALLMAGCVDKSIKQYDQDYRQGYIDGYVDLCSRYEYMANPLGPLDSDKSSYDTGYRDGKARREELMKEVDK